MSGMRITALSREGSREVTFENIIDMRIVSSLDSPADSLSATFATDFFHADFTDVKAYFGDIPLFAGKIDARRDKVSTSGMATRIDARSAGAQLLDNQAEPCVLQNAGIGIVFNKCVAPYGFTLYNPDKPVYLPVFTVRAGLSEWEAFCSFTLRAYSTAPYLKGAQVMLKRPPARENAVISNTGDGVRYTSIARTKMPYNVISSVFLRDGNGGYSMVVKNREAAYIGVDRKRYVIPSIEYADRVELDANRRIRRSMLEYESLDVTVPGFLDISPGDEIMVRDGKIRTSGFMVLEKEYLAGNTGRVTNLRAVNGAYYD